MVEEKKEQEKIQFPFELDLKTLQSIQADGIELDMSLKILSETIGRAQVAGFLGQSYQGNRDLYTALGWPKVISFNTYYSRYKRDGVAKRIVKAPVDATWRKKPLIYDDSDNRDSPFAKAWEDLVKSKNVFYYLSRIDRISGIGCYGVLLLGFDDANDGDLSKPLEGQSKLLYMRPYAEGNATIQKTDDNVNSERYGKPEVYQLQTVNKSIAVHWTRVIHVAEELEENDVKGTPRMEPVFNYLLALELVAGSSSEMFYRGAYPGLNFSIDPEAKQAQDLSDAREQIDSYVHGLQRYLRLKGIKVDTLKGEIKSPKEFVQVLTMLIAAAKGMPQRILTGSERGDLASTQDEKAWSDSTDTRRTDYAEPIIIRPFVDRLIEHGALPEPKGGEYIVDWPDISSPTMEETAKVFADTAKGLKDYGESIGGDQIIPPEVFRDMAPISEEQKREARKIIETMAEEEANDSEDEEMDEIERELEE